jgi:hypothetical protein
MNGEDNCTFQTKQKLNEEENKTVSYGLFSITHADIS